MIVVIIMSLLVSFAVGQYTGIRVQAETNKVKKDADTIANAAREYYSLNSRAAQSISDLKFSNIPLTPTGTPFEIEDPFIKYEYPPGNIVYKIYRSTGRMCFIDNQGFLRLLASIDASGTNTSFKPSSNSKPRLSPTGNMVACEASGGKIVILDLSQFNLESPDPNEIVEIELKNTTGSSPAWLSETTVVFVGKSNNPTNQNYYVRSFDVENPNDPPLELFSVGNTKPGPLHVSSKTGIIAIMNNSSPSGIDIMTSSGEFINTIPNTVKEDYFSLSADGSKICINKSGSISICAIDINLNNETIEPLSEYTSNSKNAVFSPTGKLIAFEKNNSIYFSTQSGKSLPGFRIIEGASSIDWTN
jgi:type II secretory pathway pseudopilin PulG